LSHLGRWAPRRGNLPPADRPWRCYIKAMGLPTRLAAAAAAALVFASGDAPARDRNSVFAYGDGEGAVTLTNLPQPGRSALFVLVLLRQDDEEIERLGAAGSRLPPRDVARIVDAVAPTVGLEPALLLAVIAAESGFRAKAVSPKGAQGLMQLMPATARRLGVRDPFDPEQNVRAGARYLRDLLRLFDDDLRLALAAYNAGEDAVLRHGRAVPPFPETRRYVTRVLSRYDALVSLR
jgi:soluble lytic murein transglycosylase-like protein